MKFEDELNQLDESITQKCKKIALNHYIPIFEKIKDTTIEHMETEKIEEIKLNIHDGLIFMRDGIFYHKNMRVVGGLKQLAEIYQRESEYNQACADARPIIQPSFQASIRNAIFDFRTQVKKTVVDKLLSPFF